LFPLSEGVFEIPANLYSIQSANSPNWNKSTINNKFSLFLLPFPPPGFPKRDTTSLYGESPRDSVITSPEVDSFKLGWLKTYPIAVVDLDLPPVNLSNLARGFPRQPLSGNPHLHPKKAVVCTGFAGHV
jgi:hypothetical protein